jgi:hypothetical protein
MIDQSNRTSSTIKMLVSIEILKLSVEKPTFWDRPALRVSGYLEFRDVGKL